MTITRAVDIPVSDGTTMRGQLATPPPHQPTRSTGVVIAHELFGVNPDITAITDAFAAEGFVAIAPEFYHRDSEPGRWFERDDDGRTAGFALLHKMNRADGVRDIASSIHFLTTTQGVTDVAVIGFSAGGHLAYLAACELPIARTAVLYGGWLTSTEIPLSRPEPTLTLTGGISGRLLYLVGGDDRLIDQAEQEAIGAALSAAGIDHELISYPGVAHAFFWPGTEAFDATARADAWQRVIDFLSEPIP